MEKLGRAIEEARAAALEVLLHNAHGPCESLPRTAGWGYPEPYTRDLMISSLGILVSGNDTLIDALRRTLETLAANQTPLGHIPSLAHDPQDLGASDTTPLFLVGLALYRKAVGPPDFLEEAAAKALRWMEYQSPDNLVMVAQQPTSDWRDEHWVLGYGLYVNTLVYLYLKLFGHDEQAQLLRTLMNRFDVRAEVKHRHIHEGLLVPYKPYYAVWAYKIMNDERFDLLGNSLAILSGLSSRSRSRRMVYWVEAECRQLRDQGELALSLPPCLFPYIRPEDPDWLPRYADFNQPGEYHNGGIWPFICGFWIAALVAAGAQRLALRRLHDLTELVRLAADHRLAYGFNEWHRAQTGSPAGNDWQTWSAAMYLYAVEAVRQGRPPLL